jgi:hypothetical protein
LYYSEEGHINTTHLACQDTSISGTSAKYCALNASSCSSVDDNFQPGDWAVEFEYGIVEGVAICKGDGNKNCYCRTSTFTPKTDDIYGDIERAVSSEFYVTRWSQGSLCPQNCASVCANNVKTTESTRQTLFSISNVGDCSSVENKYAITYFLNGGLGCSNESYENTTTLCKPEWSNHRFAGWATSANFAADGIVTYQSGYVVDKQNLKLYAVWLAGCEDEYYSYNGVCILKDDTYCSIQYNDNDYHWDENTCVKCNENEIWNSTTKTCDLIKINLEYVYDENVSNSDICTIGNSFNTLNPGSGINKPGYLFMGWIYRKTN